MDFYRTGLIRTGLNKTGLKKWVEQNGVPHPSRRFGARVGIFLDPITPIQARTGPKWEHPATLMSMEDGPSGPSERERRNSLATPEGIEPPTLSSED